MNLTELLILVKQKASCQKIFEPLRTQFNFESKPYLNLTDIAIISIGIHDSLVCDSKEL
jgi:hypothetical protein